MVPAKNLTCILRLPLITEGAWPRPNFALLRVMLVMNAIPAGVIVECDELPYMLGKSKSQHSLELHLVDYLVVSIAKTVDRFFFFGYASYRLVFKNSQFKHPFLHLLGLPPSSYFDRRIVRW